MFLLLKFYWLDGKRETQMKEVVEKTDILVRGEESSNLVNKIHYFTSQWTEISTFISFN